MSTSPRPLSSAGLDQSAVRRMNTAVVLRALAAQGSSTTLQSLGVSTGLSRRTLEVILEGLVLAGWAAESDQVTGGGAGRPAKSFRFVPDHRVIAALRIDTHFVHAMIVDLAGTELGRGTAPLGEAYFTPEETLDKLASALDDSAADAGVPASKIVRGTVAAGGVIDTAEGAVVRLVNAPRWSGFPLAARLSTRLGFTCAIDNDANLAALAEYHSAEDAPPAGLAWLTHGYRSGAGFVIDGVIHRGRAGSAGELIESNVLGLDRDPGPGFAMLTSPLTSERAQAAALTERARSGDADARAAAAAFAAELARIVDMLTWTIAPDVLVLGGGLEAAIDVLSPLLIEQLEATGTPVARIAPTAIGADAMLRGAAYSAIRATEQALFASIVDRPVRTGNTQSGAQK